MSQYFSSLVQQWIINFLTPLLIIAYINKSKTWYLSKMSIKNMSHIVFLWTYAIFSICNREYIFKIFYPQASLSLKVIFLAL